MKTTTKTVPYKCPLCQGENKTQESGYRELNVGEILQKGDEYECCDNCGRWYETLNIGESIKHTWSTYRRKITNSTTCKACNGSGIVFGSETQVEEGVTINLNPVPYVPYVPYTPPPPYITYTYPLPYIGDPIGPFYTTCSTTIEYNNDGSVNFGF